MQRVWLFALAFTLLLWSILLTPVQLLIRSAEERIPTAQVEVILDPLKYGSSSSSITADIIAVHGLGSNPETTWTNPETGTHWLRDVLALQFSTCRIAQVNHDTRWDAHSPVQSLRDYGQTILDSISRLRVDAVEQKRPLVLIGHSFGGILIKKALTLAAEQSHNARLHSVASSTGAIFFFGTPHKGSNFALLGTLSSHFSYWLGSRSDLLEFLTPSSTELSDLHMTFLTHYKLAFICNFFETKPMEIFGIPLSLVVTKDSAVIDGHLSVALTANHKSLQRFKSAEDPNYGVFKSYLEEGLEFIFKMAERRRIKSQYSIPFRLKGAPMSGQFVGRVRQLEDMSEFFKSPSVISRRRVLVLQGLGGIGKTQLAIEYAVQSQQAYNAILWTNGRTETALRLSLAGLAEQIPLSHVLDSFGKLKKGDSGLDQAITAVTRWFEEENNTKWLLVVDNVDSQVTTVVGSDEGRDDSYDIRKYIPSNTRGHILITTRLSRLRRLGSGMNVMELDPDEGLKVLCQASGRSADETGCSEIVKKLHGLPLALSHAGAYMNEAGISAAKYIEHYNQKSSLLLEQDDSLTYEHGSISSSWEISFAGADSRSPYAGKLLMLWAFLDNFDVWWGLFESALDNKNGLALVQKRIQTSAIDEEEPLEQLTEPTDWLTAIASQETIFMEVIRVLREFSLVQSSNDDSSSLSIHPVVHKWAIGRQDTQKWHENLDRAVTVVGRAVPLAHHTNAWLLQRRLTPTIDRLVRILKKADHSRLSCFDSMVGLAFFEFDRGHFTSAKALYQIIIPGLQKKLGLEHPRTVKSTHDQALCYRVLGEYEKAEAIWKWTLEVTTRLDGEDAEVSLRALDDLGRLRMVQGRLSEAHEFLSRSLHGKLRTQPNVVETFDTMRQLGLVCQQSGKLDEAYELHQTALRHFEKELGSNHTWTLLAIRDVGVLYHRYGRLEEAAVFLRRSLEIMETQLGSAHHYVLEILEDLAKLLEDMGSIKMAEKVYVKALDGYTSSSMGTEDKLDVLRTSIDRLRTKREDKKR
ncbi:hypothetical protein M3J09_011531 [Ascochyta lentis]